MKAWGVNNWLARASDRLQPASLPRAACEDVAIEAQANCDAAISTMAATSATAAKRSKGCRERAAKARRMLQDPEIRSSRRGRPAPACSYRQPSRSFLPYCAADRGRSVGWIGKFQQYLGTTASDFMVNSRLKPAPFTRHPAILWHHAVRSLRLEIAVRNDKAVFEAVAGNLKRRRAVQRCRHDAFERNAAKTLLGAPVVVGSDGFDPGQRQSRLVGGRGSSDWRSPRRSHPARDRAP